MQIAKEIDQNLDWIKAKLGSGVTFDVMIREIVAGHRKMALIFIDGLVKDQETLHVIAALQRVEREQIVPNTIDKLLGRIIPYMELATVQEIDEVVDQVLAGQVGLLVDGESQGIMLDLREYPVRSVEEPDLERVTRGSREGFVETIVFNTALIRRRLRDPALRFEMLTVGRNTKTDVAIAYVDEVVDPELVDEVKRRIETVSEDALAFGARTLEEYVTDHPTSPVPGVRYTERPDVAAAHLLEGHVVILTDTTPMAMILPVTVWHFTQHAEEFFHNPITGTYMRWVRMIGMAISLVLTPLWLALYLSKDSIPQWLQFVGPQETEFTIPIWLQFFLLEFGIDLIRMALIHTPNALATSLGIVGAILLGDLAVEVGLFVPETILFTAVVAIGYFAVPSIEFGLTLRLGRYLLLAAAALWHLPGLLIGLAAILLILGFKRSFGVPYLWPLIPLNWSALLSLLLRHPVPAVSARKGNVLPRTRHRRS